MDVSWLPAAKVTVVRANVLENADFPMEVTPAGIVIAVRAVEMNAASPMDVSWLPAANVTVSRGLIANAPALMDLTPAGMVMAVRALCSNAPSPMDVTPAGMVAVPVQLS